MKRIDTRTVEYTDAEAEVVEQFDINLSDGLDIPHAARKAILDVGLRWGSKVQQFVKHLSDDTVVISRRGEPRIVFGYRCDRSCCNKPVGS